MGWPSFGIRCNKIISVLSYRISLFLILPIVDVTIHRHQTLASSVFDIKLIPESIPEALKNHIRFGQHHYNLYFEASSFLSFTISGFTTLKHIDGHWWFPIFLEWLCAEKKRKRKRGEGGREERREGRREGNRQVGRKKQREICVFD